MTRKLINTRPISHLASEDRFNSQVRDLGFEVISIPSFRYSGNSTPEITQALQKSSEGLHSWHVFTSPHAVHFFAEALRERDLRADFKQIAVQGSGTAKELKALFKRNADIIPERFVSEVLAERLAKVLSAKDSVLIPASSESRHVIYDHLVQKNIQVEQVALYSLSPIPEPVDTPLSGHETLLFFSPSAVTGLMNRVGSAGGQSLAAAQAISVGPITTRALQAAGFTNIREAREHSEAGVLAVLSSLDSM